MSLQDLKSQGPLRTKQARDVAEMIADICKVWTIKNTPKYFNVIMIANSKGDVTKMLEKNEVRFDE